MTEIERPVTDTVYKIPNTYVAGLWRRVPADTVAMIQADAIRALEEAKRSRGKESDHPYPCAACDWLADLKATEENTDDHRR